MRSRERGVIQWLESDLIPDWMTSGDADEQVRSIPSTATESNQTQLPVDTGLAREWAADCASLALFACAAPDRQPSAIDRADPQPAAIIGSPDAAGIAFDIIGSIRLTRDSHVVVSLPRHRQLVVLSREGRMKAVLGRPVKDPGNSGLKRVVLGRRGGLPGRPRIEKYAVKQ